MTTIATTETTTSSVGRDARQRDLVPPGKLARVRAVVVGVGAVGRQVALQLASVGVPRLVLVDHDTVEEVNLGPQGYKPAQVGCLKVFAATDDCSALNPEVKIGNYGSRFRRSETAEYLGNLDEEDACVFCCVDSMESRKLVWESVQHRGAEFFADARVAAETVRVLASGDPRRDDAYEGTLFADAEAFRGSCTAKMTIYLGSLAASLILAQWSKWLRGVPVDRDVTLSLPSMELDVKG